MYNYYLGNLDFQNPDQEQDPEGTHSNAAPSRNPRFNYPAGDAHQMENPIPEERQEEDGAGERNPNAFQAILEGELEPWNIEMALAPVSSFSGEGDRSNGDNGKQNSVSHRRHHLHQVKLDTLKERIALLSSAPYDSNFSSNIPSEMFQALPNEVLMLIFSFLDDITLYAVGNVCRRWHQLLVSQTTSEQWQVYTRRRWPLYRQLCPVKDWFAIYSSLVSNYSKCTLTVCSQINSSKISLIIFPLKLIGEILFIG